MTIPEILRTYKKIAVIGLSPDESRPSNGVTRYMIAHGYEIVGVRPGGMKEILGRPVYEKLQDVPGPLEIVDVFRASEFIPEIVKDVIRLKAKVLWLQEGISNPTAEEEARKAGIHVISNRCILKEHRKL